MAQVSSTAPTITNSTVGVAELACNESVLVTHVESPVLFFCRLVTDEERFEQLQSLIDHHVGQRMSSTTDNDVAADGDDILFSLQNGTDEKLLMVYSVIRDRWCRGRLLSYQRDGHRGAPINAKVCLIDYGSIEIVLWNDRYIRASTDMIDNYNGGRGFCFPCSLANIRPYDEHKAGEANNRQYNSHEWSSYAAFLMEKIAVRSRQYFLLRKLNHTSSSSNNIQVISCDLIPLGSLMMTTTEEGSETIDFNTQHQSVEQFNSLSHYLVKANVARYIDQQDNAEDEEQDGQDVDTDVASAYLHDDKENRFIVY